MLINCDDPQARSYPVGGSKLKLEDARLILFIYILLSLLFQKCRDLNPWPDLNDGSELELGLLRHFQLSSQNILFMLFRFGFSITQKHF